ncbi:hypothetical protein C3495_03800 [Clostridiaceae bacterium 14S0207]|nr:hypothetical protein C3495_03800 [Clostridiaceae bacterium 14S0207]
MGKNLKVLMSIIENQSGARKKIQKTALVTCMTTTMVLNSAIGVMAFPQTKEIPNERIECNNKSKQITTENVEALKTNNEIEKTKSTVTLINEPGKITNKIIKKSSRGSEQKYTLEQLSNMNYKEMSEAVAGTTWSNIEGLFKYSTESYKFYSNKERIQYLLNDLAQRSKTFSNTDNKGIPTIIEVLRSGFYLAYYNDSLSYLNSYDFKKKCFISMNSLLDNPNFHFGTKVQNGVIASLGMLIGNTACDSNIMNKCVPLIRDYKENLNEYSKDSSKGNAMYEIIKGIRYYVNTCSYSKEAKDMEWYGKISGFLDELKNISLINNGNGKWLIDNAISDFKDWAIYYGDDKKAIEGLTEIMDNSPKYSEKFFSIASKIYSNYNGKDAHGNTIDYKKLKEEGLKHHLPKTYTFDNGTIIMDVGEKVSEEKVKRLYWAAKEVESQFFRVVGNDKALEPGNPDDILRIKIYNSPQDYKVNWYLSNVSTDNGGIYIEPRGTFYTFERTAEENIYSVEELFRHEFTHYLQSRYLVHGMWGQGPLYNNSNMNWYDEGTAEFFAGSTRVENIKPRSAIINQLSSNKEKRFSIKQVLESTYSSGWEFYNYGCVFASYLYNHDIETFNKINEAINKEDYKEYNSILSSLKNDTEKNNRYQKYMQELIDNRQNIGTPLVSDEYIKNHAKRSLSEISSDIVNVSEIKEVKNEALKSDNVNSFKISGIYTGENSVDKLTDWNKMNKKANEILRTLENKGWSGYKTVTCYFTDYKVVNGKYQFNLVFKGLLNDLTSIKEDNKKPIAKINISKNNVKLNEDIQFNGDESTDADGNIVSYLWDFGDGKTSNEVNPNHKYSKEGCYDVKLKVTDDKGAIGEETIKISVVNNIITKEQEPNDKFNDANGPIYNNMPVEGTLEREDQDTFYFNVDKKGKVSINIDSDNLDYAWVVYNANDTNKYVCWKQHTEGNTTKGEFEANEGKYYLKLYPTHNFKNDINYKVSLKGVKENVNNIITKEQEPNDKFNDANGPIYNNTQVEGTLEREDQDTFYFNVDKKGKVSINIDSNNLDYTWVVYNANDTNKYVCWRQHTEGNTTKGEFEANEGKYYLKLYPTHNCKDNIHYKINLKGVRANN